VSLEDAKAEDRVYFPGGGMREPSTGKPRFELLVPKGCPFEKQMLTRLALHMAYGAEKYEDRNWEQFQDPAALARAEESAFRHFMQWLTGHEEYENGRKVDHAAALIFNIIAAEEIKRKLSEQEDRSSE